MGTRRWRRSSAAATSTVGAGGYQSTVATYQITPPAGKWAAGQDGQYTILLLSNQVADTGGNFAAGAVLGTFTVDLTPPTASVNASDVSVASLGTSAYSFTVTYTDANGINAASIAASVIQISGPNGYDQIATLTSVIPPTNAPTITAAYTVPAPGGAWDVTAGQLHHHRGRWWCAGCFWQHVWPPERRDLQGRIQRR